MPDSTSVFPVRQKSFPACGRLIVLQGRGNRFAWDAESSVDGFNNFAAVNFPAMPEVIDLVRSAEYDVTNVISLPDGVHQYMGTAPMEIPISFKLHAFDKEYCPDGVLTMLQLAGLLHALVLPLGPENLQPVVGGFISERTDQSVLHGTSSTTLIQGNVDTTNIYPPATCYLELIRTEQDSPGIACVGYVKNVSAKLSGPFLRGPNSSQNLPTNGEFSFTFVHHPGHGNAFDVGALRSQIEQQAFAGIVQKRFYNTRDLATTSNWNSFSSPNGRSADTLPG